MKTTETYRIAVGEEELICLKDGLARFIAKAVGGRHVHNSTAYRWALKGIRGLRLPTVRIGGQLFTSKGAFSWWSQRLAELLCDSPASAASEHKVITSPEALDILRRAGIKAG